MTSGENVSEKLGKEDLAGFVASVSGDAHLAVEEDLGEGFVRLRTAEAERRQAKHDIRWVEDACIELLRNARDAHASTIYLATSREGDLRSLVCLDDGDGIPDGLQDKVFEARVTSKLDSMIMDQWGVHGRGMALFSIRANANDARIMASGAGLGTSVKIVADLTALPERADQSTLPQLIEQEDGSFAVTKGPHNVSRCVVEFSAQSEATPAVYLGSPAEVVATMRANGLASLTEEQALFATTSQELPVTLRVASATDAASLVEEASALGLSISERNAHRILSGRIVPLAPLFQTLRDAAGAHPKLAPIDIYRDSRGLKLSKDDTARFARSMERAFDELAEKYFLQLKDTPKVRVSKDSITVKFDIEKDM